MNEEMRAAARELGVRAVLTFATGAEVALDGAQVLDFRVEEGADSALLPGNVLSAQYEVRLANDQGQWSDGGSLRGGRSLMRATVQLMLEIGEKTLPCGVFVVSQAYGDEQSGSMRLLGSDSIASEMAGTFEDTLTYPAKLGDIWTELVRQTRYAWSGALPNGDAVIDVRPDWKGATLRRAAGWIAQAAGCFVRVDRTGALEVVPCAGGAVASLCADDYLTLTDGLDSFGPVTGLRVTPVGADVPTEISDGAGEMLSVEDNPLFQNGAPGLGGLMRGMLNELKGLTLNRFEFVWRGDPAMRVGMGVALTNLSGVVLRGVVSRQTLRFAEGLSATCYCGTPEAGNAGVMRIITPEGGVNAGALVGTVDGGLLAAGSVTAKSIAAGAVTTAKLEAGAVTADKIASGTVTADKLEAGSVNAQVVEAMTARLNQIQASGIATDELYAALAHVVDLTASSAEIDVLASALGRFVSLYARTGEFDFAQAQNLLAGAMLLEQGYADTVTVKNLMVTSANLLNAVVGDLVLKSADGKYYAVTVGTDGTLGAQETTVSEGELAAGQTSDGRGIVETSANIANLAAGTISGEQAVLDSILTAALTAGKITAGEALIASATIPSLYATTIQAIGNSLNLSANESIRLVVGQAVDSVRIGGRNLLRGTGSCMDDYGQGAGAGDGTVVDGGYAGNRAVSTNKAWSGHYLAVKSAAERAGIKSGDTVTLSIMVSCASDAEEPVDISLYRMNGSGTFKHFGNIALKSGRWVQLSHTYTVTDVSTLVNTARFEAQTDTSFAVLWSSPKLEKGTKPTDWSPAPEDVEARISDVSIELDAAKAAIELRATKQEVTSAVNAVQVGGTNLIRESGEFQTLTRWSINNSEGSLCEAAENDGYKCLHAIGSIGQRSSIYRLEWNAEYTLHCTAKFATGGTTMTHSTPMHYWIYKSNDPNVISASNVAIEIVSRVIDGTVVGNGTTEITANVWHHLEVRFRTPAKPTDAEYLLFRPYFFGGAASKGCEYWVRWIKLEKGAKATDWSPAPEDPASGVYVKSKTSYVNLNPNGIHLASEVFDVAAIGEDGETEVARFDEDGLHAKVVEAEEIVSASVVKTHAGGSATPANAGALAELLEDLNGKYLTGDMIISCSNITGGSFELVGVHGVGHVRFNGGTFNNFKLKRCQSILHFASNTFSTSGTAVYADQCNAYFGDCTFNASVGVVAGITTDTVWPSDVQLDVCHGTTTTLANVGLRSVVHVDGADRPYGTITMSKGGEVYNSTGLGFASAPSPSIPTVQAVTVSLSPTSTSTSGYGSKLYQGRYTSSQSFRKGVMLFTLPSDLTSADKIDSATLTLKRVAGVGASSAVAQVRCYNVEGTLYASKSVNDGATVNLDVTAAVKAMKTSGYTGLMLWNPSTATPGSKTYTVGYARFAGKGEAGAPVLKVSYRK